MLSSLTFLALFFWKGREFPEFFSHFSQAFVDKVVDGVFFKSSILQPFTSVHSGENLYSFIDSLHRVDLESSSLYHIYNFFLEHEILNITFRYHDSLLASESFGLTDLKKAFYLLVHTADCLNFSFLVNRTSHCEVLLYRQ